MKDMRANFQQCLRLITGKKSRCQYLAYRFYTLHDPSGAIPKGNAFLQGMKNTLQDTDFIKINQQKQATEVHGKPN